MKNRDKEFNSNRMEQVLNTESIEISNSLSNEIPFNFDLERMKIAVNSPSIKLPSGLSFEEKRNFFIENYK